MFSDPHSHIIPESCKVGLGLFQKILDPGHTAEMFIQKLFIFHLDYCNILFTGTANAFCSVHIHLEHYCQDYFTKLLF